MTNRLVLLAMSFMLAAGGCAHQPTPQEVQQSHEDAAARGRARFSDELVQENVSWYVANTGSLTGFNAETGLPEQLISASTSEPLAEDFVRGHNDAVLSYIRSNGAVPGSFKSYVDQIEHQSAYFEMHQSEGVQTLKIGSGSASSPAGVYTVTLRAASATGAQITTSGPQIVVAGSNGEHQSPAPSGANGQSVDILFAPSGSNLAFTRWPAGGAPIYAALDLKNGRWLAVQRGK